MKRKATIQFWISLMLFALIFGGCNPAGPASVKVLQKLKPDVNLSDYSVLELRVSKANDKVPLKSDDLDRITAKIMEKIEVKNATFYKDINPTAPQPDTLQSKVIITKYDKGSSFLRFMLAGLGQIHIYADIVLMDKTTQEQLAKYKLDKTYAAGGAMGGGMTIEECEDGFCDSAANILLGKK